MKWARGIVLSAVFAILATPAALALDESPSVGIGPVHADAHLFATIDYDEGGDPGVGDDTAVVSTHKSGGSVEADVPTGPVRVGLGANNYVRIDNDLFPTLAVLAEEVSEAEPTPAYDLAHPVVTEKAFGVWLGTDGKMHGPTYALIGGYRFIQVPGGVSDTSSDTIVELAPWAYDGFVCPAVEAECDATAADVAAHLLKSALPNVWVGAGVGAASATVQLGYDPSQTSDSAGIPSVDSIVEFHTALRSGTAFSEAPTTGSPQLLSESDRASPARSENSNPGVAAIAAPIPTIVREGDIPLAAIALGILGIALAAYSRLRRSQVCEQAMRAAIVDAVTKTPGLTTNDLARTFDVHHTTARYHLMVLERAGTIVSHAIGGRRHFSLAGARPEKMQVKSWDVLHAGAARTIHEASVATPGIALAKAARMADVGRVTAHYHVRRMVAAGLVRAEKRGRNLHLFPAA